MRVIPILSLSLIGIAVAACSPRNPEPPMPQTDGVIAQPQLDALNKAKAVGDVVGQAAQQRSTQLDP